MASLSGVHSKRQQKKKRHEGEGVRRQAKGGKHEPHKHSQLRVQKEEDTSERGKFSRRKIESNWSRYDDNIEGEVNLVASVGEAKGDEEPSAVAAREDESRAHQEDLRFKQLVESAKHRMPMSEGASEASRSFSSDLFQINVSSLAESMQNIPLNERLLMDKGLLVEAGLMEDDSHNDGKLKRMTLHQLRQHQSEDVQSSRIPQRLQASPARVLPMSTGLPSDPYTRQDNVVASADVPSATDRHAPSAAEQPLANTRPQRDSPQLTFQKTSPKVNSSRISAVSGDSGSKHMPGSNAENLKIRSVGGVAPTTPIEMSLEQPLAIGAPGSKRKIVELVQMLAPPPVQKREEDEDSQLEAMLDELLTL